MPFVTGKGCMIWHYLCNYKAWSKVCLFCPHNPGSTDLYLNDIKYQKWWWCLECDWDLGHFMFIDITFSLKCNFLLLQLSYCIKWLTSISQIPRDKNPKQKTWKISSSSSQWPIHVIMGPVQAAPNIPWRMSWTIIPLPQSRFLRHYSLLSLYMSKRFRICDLKGPKGNDFTGSFLRD